MNIENIIKSPQFINHPLTDILWFCGVINLVNRLFVFSTFTSSYFRPFVFYFFHFPSFPEEIGWGNNNWMRTETYINVPLTLLNSNKMILSDWLTGLMTKVSGNSLESQQNVYHKSNLNFIRRKKAEIKIKNHSCFILTMHPSDSLTLIPSPSLKSIWCGCVNCTEGMGTLLGSGGSQNRMKKGLHIKVLISLNWRDVKSELNCDLFFAINLMIYLRYHLG